MSELDKEKMSEFDKAIMWIAENDETSSLDSREISYLISVNLVAFMFDMHEKEVAELVVQQRVTLNIRGEWK